MNKVVVDASVLGLGYFHEQSRTGIYRVAENLVKGLSKGNAAEVAIASTEHLPETIAYLKKHHLNCNFPIVNKPGDIRFASFENNIVSSFAYKSLPQKVVREIFTRFRAKFKSSYSFDVNTLRGHDIYHSPFLPIPKELRGVRKPAKVITIHDLIPHLFPAYFGEWNVNMMKKILDCIDENTYPVCVSEATKKDLCEVTGIARDRVFVAPLAASEDKFYQVRDNEEIESILLKY